MNALLPYVLELEQHIQEQLLSWTRWTEWRDLSLNGGAAIALRQAADLSAQKGQGAFFTSPSLASRAASVLGSTIDSHVYFDPTCGAGDLLLAIARNMKLGSTVSDTLAIWGSQLAGCDISSVFVRATRARLALLAMERIGRHESLTSRDLSKLLPSIITLNILDRPELYAQYDRIIMNPPYVPVNVSGDCRWSTGLTNAAACFAADAISNASKGARVVAILPDVVRSGSRYERWREMVLGMATLDYMELFGLFDSDTDVDVFLLGITVQPGNSRRRIQWTQSGKVVDTVSDRFSVHVGAVVPHRDPEKGIEHPYIDVRCLSPWSTKLVINGSRRFEGRTFRPPFVAIRRTSSPRDPCRAVATTVLGTLDVAVENHVVVCIPHDHSIESCQRLVARLRSPRTDKWLNERIRCRHLTVSAVAGLPWWRDGQFGTLAATIRRLDRTKGHR